MTLPPSRFSLALGLLSAALIALQLALMQLLSISQWHHFAYLVVSLALLGFGASGTVLSLFRGRLLQRIDTLLPLLTLACAAAIAGQMPLVQAVGGHFDSYLLFTGAAHLGRLLIFTLFFTLPFFLGALAIGLVFVQQVERIGAYYFANLLGSGLGALGGLALLAVLPPEHLPAGLALPALVAGLLLLRRPPGKAVVWLALPTVAVTAVLLVWPPSLPLSPYKDLAGALNLPGARVLARQNDPLGQVTAVSSPALRFAPGVSLTYSGPIPGGDALFSNGNWFGVVPEAPREVAAVLDASPQGLPYALASPRSVLVLQAGTGAEVVQALAQGATRVVAVEPHRAALRLLRRVSAGAAAASFDHPAVELALREPRTYLAAGEEAFDLIVLPTLGAFGGSSGIFALQEQHLLTVEAFGEMLSRLADHGWLCVTVWMDYPPRAPLRLVATLAQALEASGRDPARHLVALRSWGAITFCVKKSPLGAADIAAVRGFGSALGFDPAVLPGLAQAERDRFNRLENPEFFSLLERALGPSRQELYAAYPFRLRPASDDRPFFSQQLRWRSLPALARLFGERTVPFLELGYLVVLLTFALVTLAAVGLILLPLLRLGWRRGARAPVLIYFGSLGVGYMLFEMVLIHRFVLFLGHPVYAAAAVIGTLLIFSGLGSRLSARLGGRRRAPQAMAALVACAVGLYALLLPPFLQGAMVLPLAAKAGLTVAVLAPPALAMGFPFPLGLQRLGRASEPDVPWAWGINGCLSVVSAALATIIAVEAGFTAVILIAAGAYLAAAAVRLPGGG